jgi:hypothetical protein
VFTNIYNTKTKGPNLMEFFTATGKLEKVFLTTRDVFDVCITGDTAHICWMFRIKKYVNFRLKTLTKLQILILRCIFWLNTTTENAFGPAIDMDRGVQTGPVDYTFGLQYKEIR